MARKTLGDKSAARNQPKKPQCEPPSGDGASKQAYFCLDLFVLVFVLHLIAAEAQAVVGVLTLILGLLLAPPQLAVLLIVTFLLLVIALFLLIIALLLVVVLVVILMRTITRSLLIADKLDNSALIDALSLAVKRESSSIQSRSHTLSPRILVALRVAQILKLGIDAPPRLRRIRAGNVNRRDGRVATRGQVNIFPDTAHPRAMVALGCQTAALVPFERVADVEREVVFPFELFVQVRFLPVDDVGAAELLEIEVCAVGEYVFAVKRPRGLWEEGARAAGLETVKVPWRRLGYDVDGADDGKGKVELRRWIRRYRTVSMKCQGGSRTSLRVYRGQIDKGRLTGVCLERCSVAMSQYRVDRRLGEKRKLARMTLSNGRQPLSQVFGHVRCTRAGCSTSMSTWRFLLRSMRHAVHLRYRNIKLRKHPRLRNLAKFINLSLRSFGHVQYDLYLQNGIFTSLLVYAAWVAVGDRILGLYAMVFRYEPWTKNRTPSLTYTSARTCNNRSHMENTRVNDCLPKTPLDQATIVPLMASRIVRALAIEIAGKDKRQLCKSNGKKMMPEPTVCVQTKVNYVHVDYDKARKERPWRVKGRPG
ncbi:hypothetical protein GMOD_00008432 [Pyrenophora seminiperda CCB06]|uniref:Uncharacterized protein n=1 Tax=Pyrenophora seminiperda CCB06 TaxID=1302712 RepID=A0A3M7M8H7_9PLEO|nr:hypothetical protein GMOD_00008432 [Pyrenophora seminiperda CCB06]